jgi:hypothetical protein
MTSVVDGEVAYFINAQNQNRGASGSEVQKYYWYEGLAPIATNLVEGIGGIAAGATTISMDTTYNQYNAVILDGGHSTSASPAGSSADNYSFSINSAGTITVLDENTGNSQQVTGASYLIFNGGALNSDGSYQSIYFVEGSTNAEIAAMYNAAFQRQPDLPGLEFYAIKIAKGELSLHQAAGYFLASGEFAKDYPALTAAADNGGPNDQAFITELYGNILHRAATADEVNFYIQDLQGKLPGQTAPDDRAQLLIWFALSSENQKDIGAWLINTSGGATYTDSAVAHAPGGVAAVPLVGVHSS